MGTDPAEAVELRPQPEGDRAAGGAAAVADAKPEVLALTDGRELAQLTAGDEQVDAGIPEAERSEAPELAAQGERERRAGDDRVDRRDRSQLVVVEVGVGVRRERLCEVVYRVGSDREAGGGAVPAEAIEVIRTRGEAGMEVEGGYGTAAALPQVTVSARDQHDGAVVALRQSRGDDPDHALVPALVREDVSLLPPSCLRPRVDDGRGLAEDPFLDRLALAVQLLQLRRDPGGGVLVVGQQQLERGRRPAETPGGVDPRGEPEADGTLVDDSRIHAGRPKQCLQAGPRGRGETTEPGDRERTVLVDEWDDVGDRRQGDEIEVTGEPLVPGPSSASASL